jgi:hypothetical protein
MPLLEELKKISDDKSERIRLIEEAQSNEKKAKIQQAIAFALEGLEERLRLHATTKKTREYEVYRTGTYGEDFHPDLSAKMHAKNAGNFFCAWRDKKIVEMDLRENMQGAFRAIYLECEKLGLKPSAEHTWDGANHEWFRIMIRW